MFGISAGAAALGGAVIGAGASIYGANKAAKGQQQAAQQASNTELAMYNQNRADLQPWRQAGATALGQLTSGTASAMPRRRIVDAPGPDMTTPGGEFNRDFTLADFQQDPGYQFRRQQGMRGLEGSAAARGGLFTGGTLSPEASRYLLGQMQPSAALQWLSSQPGSAGPPQERSSLPPAPRLSWSRRPVPARRPAFPSP